MHCTHGGKTHMLYKKTTALLLGQAVCCDQQFALTAIPVCYCNSLLQAGTLHQGGTVKKNGILDPLVPMGAMTKGDRPLRLPIAQLHTAQASSSYTVSNPRDPACSCTFPSHFQQYMSIVVCACMCVCLLWVCLYVCIQRLLREGHSSHRYINVLISLFDVLPHTSSPGHHHFFFYINIPFCAYVIVTQQF